MLKTGKEEKILKLPGISKIVARYSFCYFPVVNFLGIFLEP